MSIEFLFFVRNSRSFVIVVAIASSSLILFSNPFIPLYMAAGSRVKGLPFVKDLEKMV
jgi:hypothetical protein